MKLLLRTFITVLFTCNIALANEIVLEDHFKVISTFSGELDDQNTFHVITVKNKKSRKYELIPVSNYKGMLKRHEGIICNFTTATPKIKSYHVTNNNVVSFLLDVGSSVYPNSKCIMDVDFVSGEAHISKTITNYYLKSTLKLNNKQLMICRNYNDLHVYQIFRSDSIVQFKLSKDTDNKPFFKGIGKTSIDAINAKEFVANGSIKDYKAYCDSDNNLYLTRDVIKDKKSHVMKIGLDKIVNGKRQIEYKDIEFSQFSAAREMSSYVYQNKLFQLLSSKEAIFLNITDIATGDRNSINIREHKDIISIAEGFVSLEYFIKNLSKSKYKATVTVNDHVDENYLVVRFDYVLPEVYGYYNDWWFHHQMFFQQQQMHMNNLPNFGPSSSVDVYDFSTIDSKKKHYFELVLDKDTLEPMDVTPEYKYRDIDKKAISKENEDQLHDYSSSVFLQDLYVKFYQDETSKVFKVRRRSIGND